MISVEKEQPSDQYYSGRTSPTNKKVPNKNTSENYLDDDDLDEDYRNDSSHIKKG